MGDTKGRPGPPRKCRTYLPLPTDSWGRGCPACPHPTCNLHHGRSSVFACLVRSLQLCLHVKLTQDSCQSCRPCIFCAPLCSEDAVRGLQGMQEGCCCGSQEVCNSTCTFGYACDISNAALPTCAHALSSASSAPALVYALVHAYAASFILVLCRSLQDSLDLTKPQPDSSLGEEGIGGKSPSSCALPTSMPKGE